VPLGIHVRHAQGKGVLALAAATDAPVWCGSACDEVILPAEVLGYPLVSANAAAAAVLSGAAEEQMALAMADVTVVARVEAALRQRRGSLPPSIAVVARSLGMSVRSLQRRLREEGTSFQEVLDGIRKALALGRLREARVEADELAFVLGFSHINSFYRAFRRWTGMTPVEYSRRHGPASDCMASPARP